MDGNGTADANGTVDHLVPEIYQITYPLPISSGNAADEPSMWSTPPHR